MKNRSAKGGQVKRFQDFEINVNPRL